MQRSAEAERALGALQEHLKSLEQLCNELEIGLRACDWDRMTRAFAETRRAMHAFENAMADAKPFRTEAIDRHVFGRLQKIFDVRDDQMRRLKELNETIGNRLRSISQWKEYARSIAGSAARTVKPRIFEDVR